MKKVFVLACLVMLGSVAVASAAPPAKSIELGIGGGVAVPTTSGYDLGFGGTALGLYRTDENMGIGLGVGFHTFNVTGSTSAASASSSSLDILATLKYAFGTTSTKPYILVGAGFSNYSYTLSVSVAGFSVSGSGSSLYPEISGGVGVQFPVGDSLNIYVQGVADLVLSSGSSFTFLPLEAGLNFDI